VSALVGAALATSVSSPTAARTIDTAAAGAPSATWVATDAQRPIADGTDSSTTALAVRGFRVATAATAAMARRPVPAPLQHDRPARAAKPAPPVARAAAPSYHGRNQVWIPALGINRSVSTFSCSRAEPPDDLTYRWGCAGKNNVYLLGHAYSVFKPLHDAYVHGRLKKGMRVWYANGSGHVHVYSVIWWRVTAPTTAASWAWAAQARPSMTLQTCVGADNQYRLMVRLVQVG
jgi:Sortase domain